MLGVVQLGLNVGVVMELASGDLEKFIQSRSTRMSGSQNKVNAFLFPYFFHKNKQLSVVDPPTEN